MIIRRRRNAVKKGGEKGEENFFIDYENVDVSGLDGLTKLTGQDCVWFFYSEKHSRMSFGLHRRITESPAQMKYTKIYEVAPNLLDRKLMEEAEQVTRMDTRADYFIISKDQGYKGFIQRQNQKGININLFPNIAESNQKKKDDLIKLIKARLINDKKKQYNLSEQEIKLIACMIMESENKSELNVNLQKLFYNQDVKYIFTRIKDITYNL